MGLAAQGGEFFLPAMPDELAEACPDVIKHRCRSSILPFQGITIFSFFMTMVRALGRAISPLRSLLIVRG
jgi:hypothetical protein